MADGLRISFDTQAINVALDRFSGPMRESLARRMAVSAGRIFRDDAKARVGISSPPYNPSSRGSQQPGTLQRAIYLAFSKERSTDQQVIYSISWNARKAWWGKLQEFGHWQQYVIRINAEGNFYTTKQKLPGQGKWIAAKPFLRPALDSQGQNALRAAVQTGRDELPRLLAESGNV